MSMTDVMFYQACIEAAKYSRCLSRQIGVVIVVNGLIRSMGYNGPPATIPSCNKGWYKDMIGREVDICPRYHINPDLQSGEGLDKCIAVHAERSALIHAAQNGVNINNGTLFMTCGIPCKDCMVEIIEAGISEIVVTEIYEDGAYYDIQSEYLAKKTLMKIRKWELDS